MKREKQPFPAPDCLGWYTACETCDGDPEELAKPPCAARMGCRSLVNFIGGESLRDAATVAAVRRLWPVEKLARYVDDGAGLDGVSPREQRRAVSKTVSYRPTEEKYQDSLIVFDAVVRRFAHDAGKTVVDESVSYKGKDTVYVRWHANGRALLREVRRGYGTERTIAKLIPLIETPAINVVAYTELVREAYALTPPRAVPCRAWDDGRGHHRVALVGVTASTARDAGSWLARVLEANLIGRKVE